VVTKLNFVKRCCLLLVENNLVSQSQTMPRKNNKKVNSKKATANTRPTTNTSLRVWFILGVLVALTSAFLNRQRLVAKWIIMTSPSRFERVQKGFYYVNETEKQYFKENGL
jgi:beta-lactamase regulating signal transducer with metallopeptidase domain